MSLAVSWLSYMIHHAVCFVFYVTWFKKYFLNHVMMIYNHVDCIYYWIYVKVFWWWLTLKFCKLFINYLLNELISNHWLSLDMLFIIQIRIRSIKFINSIIIVDVDFYFESHIKKNFEINLLKWIISKLDCCEILFCSNDCFWWKDLCCRYSSCSFTPVCLWDNL